MLKFLKYSIKSNSSNKFNFTNFTNFTNTKYSLLNFKRQFNFQNLKPFTENNNSNKNTVDKPIPRSVKPPPPPPSKIKKLFQFFKTAKAKIWEYGLTAVYIYVALYIFTGIMFYFLFKLGIFDQEAILNLIKKFGFEERLNYVRNMLGENYTTLVIAIIVNELFEFVRLPLLIVLLPRILKKKIKK
jgi:hypothetical protein